MTTNLCRISRLTAHGVPAVAGRECGLPPAVGQAAGVPLSLGDFLHLNAKLSERVCMEKMHILFLMPRAVLATVCPGRVSACVVPAVSGQPVHSSAQHPDDTFQFQVEEAGTQFVHG